MSFVIDEFQTADDHFKLFLSELTFYSYLFSKKNGTTKKIYIFIFYNIVKF